MARSDSPPPVHVLLVSLPSQGNVNPLLRLGKLLASQGLLVTFATTETVGKPMREAANNNIFQNQDTQIGGQGFIRFEFFKDGWEEHDPRRHVANMDVFLPQLERVGSIAITGMINRSAELGRPVSCLIYNLFVPWVADVAESFGIPSAMLWVQSAACFSIYYHYVHELIKFPSVPDEPNAVTHLPHMPALALDELPGFLHPTSQRPYMTTAMIHHFKNLEKNFCVLMDTFDELEHEVIEYMSNFVTIRSVGPLLKYLENDASSLVRGDIINADVDCVRWLEGKPAGSVVYISFGSVAYLKPEQMCEIAQGLMSTGVTFLWVVKPPNSPPNPNKDKNPPMLLPKWFMEAVGEKGKVVAWSPQDEVLKHPSVGVFLTHCGWNSTIEALTYGVPVIAFPLWGDQLTNAKYLEEVFKVGVRMSRGESERKLIGREVVEKCLKEVMVGSKAMEMRENAAKWKIAAAEAAAVGGFSHNNFQVFLDDLRRKKNVASAI